MLERVSVNDDKEIKGVIRGGRIEALEHFDAPD